VKLLIAKNSLLCIILLDGPSLTKASFIDFRKIQNGSFKEGKSQKGNYPKSRKT
jgi:hypothetical protein